MEDNPTIHCFIYIFTMPGAVTQTPEYGFSARFGECRSEVLPVLV
jgi:hypothetical protein